MRSSSDPKRRKPARRISASIGARPALRMPDGSGRPLDAGSRRFFEQRFGVDFAAVRIHADAEATATARAHQARAFTIGNQIAVDTAELAGPAGRRLLAHELAHVVQQTSRGPGWRASSTTALEADANQAAHTAIAGTGRATVQLSAPVAVAFDRRSSPSAGYPRSAVVTPRAETEAEIQREVARRRPMIPRWWERTRMENFDSTFYRRASDWFDFRGRVMLGGHVNYYFIAMAMAHQGYPWWLVQEMIWLWNMRQRLPWVRGDPNTTAEMWFAAREGYQDEIRRMAAGAARQGPAR